jgi:hypothetical protein
VSDVDSAEVWEFVKWVENSEEWDEWAE